MLILVRHGQSEHNAAGVLVGRSDPSLTSLGREQAVATARFLAGRRSRASSSAAPTAETGGPVVLSSPLSRARVTAEAIAAAIGDSVEVELDERLIELDYGIYDGRRMVDLDRAELQAWRADPTWRPPGGETLAELHDRVAAWCDGIVERAARSDVIAVSHVSPIKAAVAWATGMGPEASWRMSLAVASITRISTMPRSLHSFGETSHLTV